MADEATISGMVVMHVDGPRLDAANVQVFRDLVACEIERGNGKIILDMAHVQFIDSSGIGTLVGLLKRVGNRGDLVLATLTPAVERAFKLTRMDRIFTICPNVSTAAAHIEAR